MNWAIALILLGACFAAGTTGAMFPPGEWYRRLNKPRWTPPDWLFPVAWTTLYLLMAGAGGLVAGRPGADFALALWALQIALNTLWTPVFFGLRRIRAGMLVLALLWLAVAATLVALWRVEPWAGAMFIPYLAWVSVAGALNLAVWRLNPAEAKA
ncbi:tryptophan-rich sensory protein TspO [Limimaricola pyoseonensis]|uniref:TspO and MBR related proteins n=1 Tax=Limimaricola pyoseonensis TaxID=521013 RepID=A0A1G7B1E0_9RHOB|nr:TspO/MBR family protein [Limimaricola pyoseonensis]SDE20909.1 TspO and MBR related proteins [Limimaricola pyoseonensis]